MRTIFVLVLMALSFVAGTMFGQWTNVDFLAMVMDRTNAEQISGEAEMPVSAAAPVENTSEDDTPPAEPEREEPTAEEPTEETVTETPVADDPVPDGDLPVPADSDFELVDSLGICPRMTVRNAPPVDAELAVAGYEPFVLAEDSVVLAVAPTEACVSSGFGPRNGRIHKGLDFRTDTPGTIYAAAPGTVREAHYRDDYGNQVVIDHGDGVFTRYAHLAAFAPEISVGADVQLGTPLGPMGNTASYSIPVHLHYEVLVGDYDTPAKSFGLTPKSVFDYPYVAAP